MLLEMHHGRQSAGAVFRIKEEVDVILYRRDDVHDCCQRKAQVLLRSGRVLKAGTNLGAHTAVMPL